MNDTYRHAIVRRVPHKQRGLTLIEVVVAMTIGLFLLGGVMTIVSGIRNSYSAQTQLAQLQDDERLAMTVLTDVIQAAGYFPDPISNTAISALPASAAFPTAGQAITGTSAAGGPDTIGVRFASTSADGMINCLGGTNPNAALAQYENRFSVNNGQLLCSLNGAAAVPLVNGMQNLVILYGVNTGGGTQVCTDSYFRASEVVAKVGNWNSICSVKITLTFTNPLYQGQANQPQTIQFTRVIAVMSTAGSNT
jgi:type IV pilus assembly protein PilW